MKFLNTNSLKLVKDRKIKFYQKNNYNLKLKTFFKNFSNDYSIFLYSFFLKKNFLRIGNFNNLRKPVLLKNFLLKQSNTHTFLQNSISSGNKLMSLNNLNYVRCSFYYIFLKKFDFFLKKFPNYIIYFTFSETEKKFFNLDFLFNIIYNINESVFNTKVVKLSKKLKQKTGTKSKYSLEFKYLHPSKRKNFLFKQLNLNSNNFNFYTHRERLFMSFCNTFFLEKNSDIYMSKLNAYKNILKKNSN